ncbi:MAPEG family protein [Brevundimonas sp.]|uniref:MAPEG family protein n=1 Tax=Brevundimonas sp. TaxID=1871086 RepID=UPI0028AE3194|nr:MAPEG family protein [Brevundimonas sp.]
MTGTAEKKSIGVRSVLALGVTAASLSATWLWLPPALFGAETDMATADRLAYALKWELPVLVWLAGCLRLVASIRYRSDEDRPGAAYGPPSARLAVPAAVLQNSLEQTVLAVGAHLILAVVLRGEELILIPALVTLYLLGRVMFAIGYAKGAAARAFGMALTGASTLAAMVIAIVLLILGR